MFTDNKLDDWDRWNWQKDVEWTAKVSTTVCFCGLNKVLTKGSTCFCYIRALLALRQGLYTGFLLQLLSWLPSHAVDQLPWAIAIELEAQINTLDVQTQGSPPPSPDTISQFMSILIILSHLPLCQWSWEKDRIISVTSSCVWNKDP